MSTATRLAIGISCDPRWGDVDAALVEVTGSGLWASVQTLASRAASAVSASQGVPGSSGPGPAPPQGRSCWDTIRAVLDGLVHFSPVSFGDVLVLGLWNRAGGCEPVDMAMLAAQLAEHSGITTLGGFVHRDLAAAGNGEPLYALIDWMTARNANRARIGVHVDQTSTIIHLPAGCSPEGVQAIDAGPGVGLLERLSAAWAHSADFRDPRGMLAVQGRQIKPLIRRWAGHASLRRRGEARQHDDLEEQFIAETVRLATDQNWTMSDILCTATHLVAASPADAARRFLEGKPPAEVFFVGQGTVNGFLLRLLIDQFAAVGIQVVQPGSLAGTVYEASTAAVLACLALDAVAGNIPSVTRAHGPRLLGQFTPGAPENWKKCVDWMQMALASPGLVAA